MLADHVHAKVLQDVKVKLHGLVGRRRVDAIGPVSLVESAELEDEFAVQQRPSHAVDHTGGDGAEARVTADLIVAQAHGDIVKRGRVRAPQLGRVDFEAERRAALACFLGDDLAVLRDGEIDRYGLIGGAEDGDVDC